MKRRFMCLTVVETVMVGLGLFTLGHRVGFVKGSKAMVSKLRSEMTNCNNDEEA